MQATRNVGSDQIQVSNVLVCPTALKVEFLGCTAHRSLLKAQRQIVGHPVKMGAAFTESICPLAGQAINSDSRSASDTLAQFRNFVSDVCAAQGLASSTGDTGWTNDLDTQVHVHIQLSRCQQILELSFGCFHSLFRPCCCVIQVSVEFGP